MTRIRKEDGKMTGFTKGPWEMDDEGDRFCIYANNRLMAEVLTDKVDDAHLIAAAPEMDDALAEAERFMAYFAGETDTFVGPGTPKTCLEQIRAVRRKARGTPT